MSRYDIAEATASVCETYPSHPRVARSTPDGARNAMESLGTGSVDAFVADEDGCRRTKVLFNAFGFADFFALR